MLRMENVLDATVLNSLENSVNTTVLVIVLITNVIIWMENASNVK